VNGNTGAGAIGDRVWLDADGDGRQDPTEVGLAGVTVQLLSPGPDGIYGNGDDPAPVATTTDANGNYIFNGLTAGSYKIAIPISPAGYAQTGDPDKFGSLCITCDNQTTTPIILGPGDVFANADFGYQPPANTTGSIGDTVWLDANGNGALDGGEYGIGGVSVALINDTNDDGVWDPDGADNILGTTDDEPILTTTFTDSTGAYLFTGLPTGTNADYLVWVNDTDNVLGGADPTYDATGTADGLSRVQNLTIAPVTNQDFGYAPDGYKINKGLIGDTIYLNLNGNAIQDVGEPGLEGVVIELYDSTGTTLLSTTTTDENGRYYFVDLNNATYVVKVAASNFTNGGVLQGMNNTADPDAGTANESTVTISAGNLTNLNQDYGYTTQTDPGSINGTLWNDADSDGFQDAGETIPYQGVTIDLYRDLDGDGKIDPGEPKIGTAVTDASGNYSFTGLSTTDNGVGASGADYIIDVTDTAGILNGLWHSTGANQTANGYSKVDPYPVSLTAAIPNNDTADFGYYLDPAAIGNRIWLDQPDSNPTTCDPNGALGVTSTCNIHGVQDAGEAGIAGVTVRLEIAYPNGHMVTLFTVTDANGYYSFPNLLQDEDYGDGQGTEPVLTVKVLSTDGNNATILGGKTVSPIDGYCSAGTEPCLTSSTDFVPVPDGIDANDPVGALAAATKGQNDTSAGNDSATINWADFGYYDVGTTPVSLVFFQASRKGAQVRFEWSTATETGNAGFNLYVEDANGRQKLNGKLIRTQHSNSLQPLTYSFFTRASGTTFYIEEVSVRGETRSYGPFQLGVATGSRPQPEAINWQAIRGEHDARQAAREAMRSERTKQELQGNAAPQVVPQPSTVLEPVIIVQASTDQSSTSRADAVSNSPAAVSGNKGKPKPTATPTPPPPTATPPPPTATPSPTPTPPPTPDPAIKVADLQVGQTGIYRLTYEDLLGAGFDLNGKPAASLAVTVKDQPVAIRVASPATFGPGSYLEFYGQALDTLYTTTNVYSFWLDQARALRVSEDTTQPDPGAIAPVSYMETARVNNNLYYSHAAPGNNPWYEAELWDDYGNPVAYNFPIQLDAYAANTGAASLSVTLWGVTDWDANPDHHVKIGFNGTQVAEAWFESTAENVSMAALPGNLIQNGANTLTVTVVGDFPGVDWDGVDLDRYSVTYPRLFEARNGALAFRAIGTVFRVNNLPTADVVAYRLENGTPVYLSNPQATLSGTGYQVAIPGVGGEADYIVSSAATLLKPVIKPVRVYTDITSGNAQYLVITHPDFIVGLTPLIQARQAVGLTVRVVDVEDIYAQASYGVFDPAAIKSYITHAIQNMGTQYVLLVGADSYDYRNYTGQGSLSFIPSLYARTGAYVNYAPVDPSYVDVDNNGVPDRPIGRLPVRTAAELQAIIEKTLAYAEKNYAGTAVFASDEGFKSDSESFIAQLPNGWSVQRANIDDAGVTAARLALRNALNAGVAYTSFVGHSGPDNWTYLGLFLANDAATLTNFGRSSVVTQWGCWNTYYVDPTYNTMGHRFLLSGTNGAVAVLGSTTLSYDISERSLGALLTPRLTAPGVTIGDAIQQAKAQLAASNPALVDVLLGWTLLGDPYLKIQP
jgi:hypothetical protein